jgi:hypothetical protein
MTSARVWMWLAGGAVLASATGLAIYFAQSPAQASGEETLPQRPPASAVQTTGKRDDIFPDPELAVAPQDKRLARYDKNKNGIVEQAEYSASRRKAFDKLDSNADGKLSFDEYALKTVQKFEGADANRNGKLEAAEFATTARAPTKKKCACAPDEKD